MIEFWSVMKLRQSLKEALNKTSLSPILTLAVLFTTVFSLRGLGRRWWCASGDLTPWTSDAWSRHTSQHLFDPYSFTHVLHGLVLYGLLSWGLPKLAGRWRFLLTLALEAIWEVFENTNYIIDRYRATTAAIGYEGDSIWNSLGDITACAAGFLIAMRLGLRRSAIVFVAVELVLLFWVRDSLVLNIVLLLYPIETLKIWQAGH